MVILVSRFRSSQIPCGILSCELRNQKDTRAYTGPSVRRRGTRPPSYVPIFIAFGGTCSKMRGGFRVLSQQSESADNRPNTAGQNGAIVNQAARPSSDGGAERPATRGKAKSGERKHATAFLTLAAAGGAITAAVFTGWQATTADQGLRASNRAYVHSTNFRFVHYGAKNERGRTQWSISPLIENTGNTGTRGMLMNSMISSAGEPDF